MSLILLVEDVEDNRELARVLLESAGHEVVEAHDGGQAVLAARKHLPALILMDLSLPDVDGWEAFRRIRADALTSHIPVVALTAHAMSGDRERVLAAGFDGYISKPLPVATFTSLLDPFLGG
ncbi:MAG: chemotaxis protein CheY [Cyanobacteria bacterium RYN_339]|nr:chemotaxis protein CheY [Cyanobacteria bacterium RYN_339]